jgi:hypothetical protein
MTSHRTTLLKLVLLAIISAVMPSSASAASPLLGGYGGPGQGNQAILGSALLNGPRGGGGTGAGSPGASGSAASSSSIGAPVSGARVVSRGPHVPVRPGYSKQAAGTTGQTSGGSSSPYPVSERGGVAQLAVADSGTLGLSGADLLYALLALCALVFTAGLTRHLTRIAVAGRHE